MIQLGDSGHYVRAWQRIAGLFGHAVTSRFDDITDKAVRAWQLARGVEPDGVVGPLTRAVVQPGDLIKPYEGCVLQAYDDARDAPLNKRLLRRVGGVWRRLDGTPCQKVPTIGWGDTAAPRRGIETCTRQEADAWFAEDLGRTRLPAVRRYQQPDWDAAMVEAACCFCYNEGTGALATLAGNKFSGDHWLLYDVIDHAHDAGLLMRRQEELALFLVA